MADRDINGVMIAEGDIIRLTKGMRVGRVRKGVVTRINGGDIYVECNLGAVGPKETKGVVMAHRYGCEMEVILRDGTPPARVVEAVLRLRDS
jgi:hypothetical protein